jgi:hypothetical protein
LRRRAKLAKLTHHRILAHKRRMQTADHFHQKLVRLTSAMDLESVFIRENLRLELAPV